MSKITITKVSPSEVLIPQVGTVTIFMDEADDILKYKNSDDDVFPIGASNIEGDIILEAVPPILGDIINFSHSDYGSEVDIISIGITEITRGVNQPIFNQALEGSYSFPNSPAGTEWNSVFTDGTKYGFGDLSNLTSRIYSNFAAALGGGGNIGANILTTELVMHDLNTDKYYTFQFTSWTSGGAGGGFAYTRQEVEVQDQPKIIFPDNTVQTTAAGIPIAGTNIGITESIGLDGVKYYTIDSLVGGVQYANVIFVDPTWGNNGTAQVGRFDLPFQTISQATTVAAGLGGSISQRVLIYIRKGTYSGSVNLTNWVDFYCESGVVFTGSGNVRDLGVAVTSNFYGYAKFVSKTSQALFVTGNSTVNFEFDIIENTSGQCLRIEPPIGGQCDVSITGNSIFATTNGVGYAIALRRKCNVVMNIRKFIRAYHSVFDIRDNYDGLSIVNCPKVILDANNIYGGNFKQGIIQYSSTINARFILNGDLYNEMPAFLGGIAGMVTNWSSCNGSIEVNGNIYAGYTFGVYCSGNVTPSKIIVNGSIFSKIQAIWVSSNSSCYVRNGVVIKDDPIAGPTVAMNQNAKLFMGNCAVYNLQVDGDLINVINTTNDLNLYNVIGQSEGVNGYGIVSASPVNVKVHNTRMNKPIGLTITDVLTPTGYINDPLMVVPKF